MTICHSGIFLGHLSQFKVIRQQSRLHHRRLRRTARSKNGSPLDPRSQVSEEIQLSAYSVSAAFSTTALSSQAAPTLDKSFEGSVVVNERDSGVE